MIKWRAAIGAYSTPGLRRSTAMAPVPPQWAADRCPWLGSGPIGSVRLKEVPQGDARTPVGIQRLYFRPGWVPDGGREMLSVGAFFSLAVCGAYGAALAHGRGAHTVCSQDQLPLPLLAVRGQRVRQGEHRTRTSYSRFVRPHIAHQGRLFPASRKAYAWVKVAACSFWGSLPDTLLYPRKAPMTEKLAVVERGKTCFNIV